MRDGYAAGDDDGTTTDACDDEIDGCDTENDDDDGTAI